MAETVKDLKNRFMYSALNQAQKVVYDAICSGIEKSPKDPPAVFYADNVTSAKGALGKDIGIAIMTLKRDRPEWFFLEKDKFNFVNLGGGSVKIIRGTTYTGSEICETYALVNGAVRALTIGLEYCSDWQKLLNLYTRIAKGFSYRKVINDPDCYTAAGIIRNGYGVCAAFTNLFILCCRYMGIPAHMVVREGAYENGYSLDAEGNKVRKVKRYGHAWAAVYINGKAYHCDLSSDVRGHDYCSYFYFCMGSDDLYKTHEVTTKMTSAPGREMSLFEKTGASFKSSSEAAAWIVKKVKAEQKYLHFRLDLPEADIRNTVAAALKGHAYSLIKRNEIGACLVILK